MEQRRFPAEDVVIVYISPGFVLSGTSQFGYVEQRAPPPALFGIYGRLHLTVSRSEFAKRDQCASAGRAVEGHCAEEVGGRSINQADCAESVAGCEVRCGQRGEVDAESLWGRKFQ